MKKEYSLDKKFEVAEAIKNLSNISDKVCVNISISEMGERRPAMEMSGELSTEELAELLEKRRNTLHLISQKDKLTGLFNRAYFEKRINTVDRSQVLPVAVINFNINDWRYVNENFGEEESDRLIQIIARILVSESKPYFIIGRVDGDVFGVVIPMALPGEAEEYINEVKNNCDSYDDYRLAPSVAAGVAYKENVNQNIEDLMSEAENKMFEDKYKVKNAEGYRQRLERWQENE